MGAVITRRRWGKVLAAIAAVVGSASALVLPATAAARQHAAVAPRAARGT